MQTILMFQCKPPQMRIMFGQSNTDSIRLCAIIKKKPEDPPTQVQVYSNVKNGDVCAYYLDPDS